MLERNYFILLRDIGRGSEEGGDLGLESGPEILAIDRKSVV